MTDFGSRSEEAKIDPKSVVFRSLEPGDLGWVVSRNSAFYSSSYGFNSEFELLLLEIFADYSRNFDQSRDCGIIAASGKVRLGSIFCRATEDPDTAKLRVLYVEPEARGLGLGKRLVDACLEYARGAGYRRMTLMTLQTQTLARDIYKKCGFRMIEAVSDTQFGVGIVEETWELEL